MSGYYSDLTVDEQGKVLAAMAGLKLNASAEKPITRQDINMAFAQATGKALSLEYMRDPSVVQLMGLLGSGRGDTGVRKPMQSSSMPMTSSTDRHLAARGLPVPASNMGSTIGSTRYSARTSR